MFGVGGPELIVVLLLALLLFGPQKLPEIARQIGKAMGDFRRVMDDTMSAIQEEPKPRQASDSIQRDNKTRRAEDEGEAE